MFCAAPPDNFHLCRNCSQPFEAGDKQPVTLGCGHTLCKQCCIHISTRCPFNKVRYLTCVLCLISVYGTVCDMWVLVLDRSSSVIYFCSPLCLSHDYCKFWRWIILGKFHYTVNDFLIFVKKTKYFSNLFYYMMIGVAHKKTCAEISTTNDLRQGR